MSKSSSFSFLANFNKEKMRFFAQDSTSDEFEYFINVAKEASFNQKIFQTLMNFVYYAQHVLMINVSLRISSFITNYEIPSIMKSIYLIPLGYFSLDTFKTFTQNSEIEAFIDEMYEYRCCDENNIGKTECMGKIPEPGACIIHS